MLHILWSSQKSKFKQQSDTTTHPLECWQKCRAIGTIILSASEKQNDKATMAISHKTKSNLIILSSKYVPWYLHKGVENLSCMQMFIAALFIMAQNWKQLSCLLIVEQINTLWHIQIIEYYSELKRNELSSYEKIRREFKHILLIERSPFSKDMH